MFYWILRIRSLILFPLILIFRLRCLANRALRRGFLPSGKWKSFSPSSSCHSAKASPSDQPPCSCQFKGAGVAGEGSQLEPLESLQRSSEIRAYWPLTISIKHLRRASSIGHRPFKPRLPKAERPAIHAETLRNGVGLSGWAILEYQQKFSFYL